MTERDRHRPETDGPTGTSTGPSRRQLLTALGAAAMPLAAGCTGSSESNGATNTPTPTDTMTATDTQETTAQETTGMQDPIHPRFGYVGTRGDSRPLDPDHVVELAIRPRQNAPIPEFYFEPTGLAIETGDVVEFRFQSPHHNVNAYHPAFGYTQRVPEDAPPYSSPVQTAGEFWLYRFEQEGVHNIMCAPHELFGMVGSIVVGSPTGPAANPVGEAPKPSERSRPPEFTAALVLSDPAMTPDNIAAQGAVSWDDLAEESKRPLLRPVEGE